MTSTIFEPLNKISRDLLQAAKIMTIDEVRYSVDLYYQIQDFRKSAKNQQRASIEPGEPANFLEWTGMSMRMIEDTIKRALDRYSDSDPVGEWAKSIIGIGPVIASGLLAHIDIEKAPTVGHIWRFAGLDPTQEWKKGTKRPWNAALKVLCWKIGESFVKVSGNPNDFYGQFYIARKEQEVARNEKGEFADQAKAKLERFKIGKDTEARKWYEQGKLPPAHIHARAKRYAVKLFLSHYQHVAYVKRYGVEPPKPYVISIMGHADFVKPPNF